MTLLVDQRRRPRNQLDVVPVQNQLVLHLLRSRDRHAFEHLDLPDFLLSQEVADLDGVAGAGDGGVDRKVSVDEPHLVAVALGDADDEVADVAERGADGGAGLPGAEPGLDLQLLFPRGLVGDELEVEVEVLEVSGELPAGTFHLDDLGLHLDGDAVRDVHALRGQNRLHFQLFRRLTSAGLLHQTLTSPHLRSASRRRASSTRAQSDNVADSSRHYDFDLFTIGAGSGGVRASRFASNFGAKVAVCELPFAAISSDTTGGVGGTCVLRGCVPKKLLVYASKYTHEFDDSIGYGWKYETEPKHDWSTLMANKNAELQRLTGIYKNVLKNANVTLVQGRGKVVDPHTVDVDGKLYSARHILISVGGRPFIPDIPGSEYAIDSDAALDLPDKPGKIAIVGGGYIALEFAGIFNGLRSDVHVFIRQKQVLRGFDEEIRGFVSEQMSVRGIEFHTEESPQAILKSADGSFSLKTNKGTVGGFSHVMFATGRRPNTKNLGLEEVGVKIAKNGAIEVDEFSRTSVPSIWAVGDVTDRVNLTPVALMEGGALAKTLFLNEPTKPDYSAIPSAVFSQPPIGQVGLSEEQATEQYGDVDIYTSNFRPMKATLSGLPDRVFMKLIVCAKTNKLLGLHMCGEDSPEIVQGFAVAVKAGLTKADLDATIGIHPTAAEEFVTMRTPTRKIRKNPPSQEKPSDVKAAAGV